MLRFRLAPTDRVLQLCGVLSKERSLQRTHFVRSCGRCLRVRDHCDPRLAFIVDRNFIHS
jgi:hypothetical protein